MILRGCEYGPYSSLPLVGAVDILTWFIYAPPVHVSKMGEMELNVRCWGNLAVAIYRPP